MGSYCVGYQPLNSPTTPFSTSRKVLQRYDLFPNQPNFFLDFFCSKSMAFASQKYGTYGSKPWELRPLNHIVLMPKPACLCSAYASQTTRPRDYETDSAILVVLLSWQSLHNSVIPLIRNSKIPWCYRCKTGGEVQKHRIFYPKRSDLFVQNIRSFYAKGKGK